MSEDVAARLLRGDAALFEGPTAQHALGWLTHPERYLGGWLEETADRLPRRHARTVLLGMGGSSSPARLYAEARPSSDLVVLDTSHPDTIAATPFDDATVVAASKSGSTVETQTLLAHALSRGLEPRDLVVVTDPGTSLAELATSLGAVLVLGDPDTGGRFSALSPFGLVPALLAGWTPAQLRDELAPCALTPELVEGARDAAQSALSRVRDGWAFYDLGADPIVDGGALWLEQLLAETTGKAGRGLVPLAGTGAGAVEPAQIQHWHLTAAIVARGLGVDPFNQPDVDGATREVFALLSHDRGWRVAPVDLAATRDALASPSYNVIQAFAPLDAGAQLVRVRERAEEVYGVTTANLGPRYLHSTGQLHKGGPPGVAAVQVLVRPRSAPQRIMGRHYSFHDLLLAQARSDLLAMRSSGRDVTHLVVDELAEAAGLLALAP
ncbi:MAG: hypothetical protein KGJ36_09135 [Acidobacteriota bacterium]|nr:hypothetical protein [Acidobacteriota bacterium]